MKEEIGQEEFENDLEINDDQSSITKKTTTTTIPFSDFYIRKRTISNSSSNQNKLLEQITNTSSNFN